MVQKLMAKGTPIISEIEFADVRRSGARMAGTALPSRPTGGMKATHFGLPFSFKTKPAYFSGYYKYLPGEKFTNRSMKEIKDRIDQDVEPHNPCAFLAGQDATGVGGCHRLAWQNPERDRKSVV